MNNLLLKKEVFTMKREKVESMINKIYKALIVLGIAVWAITGSMLDSQNWIGFLAANIGSLLFVILLCYFLD